MIAHVSSPLCGGGAERSGTEGRCGLRASPLRLAPLRCAIHLPCKRGVKTIAALLVLAFASGASAQIVAGDTFADGKDGAKVHSASGFVCPSRIGSFERDAVGETDPEAHSDFCAYSALDGVYGTIKLTPLQGSYDPKQSLAGDFAEQEATGGKKIADSEVNLAAAGNAAPLTVFTRSYETSKLEDLHYRVLFAGVAVKSWAVEATIEFAEPRDTKYEREFLEAVYAAEQSEIGAK